MAFVAFEAPSHHHRAGGHELHQFAEKGALLVYGVEALGLGPGSMWIIFMPLIFRPESMIICRMAPVQAGGSTASGLTMEKVTFDRH